jgi:hypothetical protein
MTYLFGIDLDYISSDSTNVLKKSFESMCKRLGEPFTTIVLKKKRSLRPSDFETDEDILTICHCIMKYQLHRMQEICKGDVQLREVANEASPQQFSAPISISPATP